MYRKIVLNLTFSFLSLFVMNNSPAQWQPDVRLTNNSAASYLCFNNGRSIAASGNSVHVVWYDERDGNQEVYYKRSTNGGLTWGADARLSYDINVSEDPSVAVSGNIVIVTWSDNRNTSDYEIYSIRSTDGGSIWGLETRLTNTTGSSSYSPAVLISGTLVHLVWEDYRDGNREIYYKRSTNSGASWGTDVRLTNNIAQSWYVSLSASGSYLYTAWQDNRDANYEIYFKRSTDDGLTWGADTRMTNNTGTSWYASIGSAGSLAHIVWEESRDGNYEIYYKRSTDNGLTWGTDTRLTNQISSSQKPSLSVSGSNLHIVWEEARDGNIEIYYKRSSDGGLTWGSDTRLTNNTGTSYHPFIAVNGLALHVTWYDNRDGNDEIYYKRDTTGNPVALHQISSEVPMEFKLYQNYPNPFNPNTVIRYSVKENTAVKLAIFNSIGQEVSVLVSEPQQPGTYEADWDASGSPSGIYYYRLTAGNFIQTNKMILMK